MKRILILIGILSMISCRDTKEQVDEKTVLIEGNSDSLPISDIKKRAEELKDAGYQTFTYEEGDTTYLMQQYYLVLLKSGPQRSQDSTEAAELQKKHLQHLGRLYKEGYTSLTGPMGDDGEIRGIIVFNTPTQKEADSLAKLDPMVKAGRLIVETHPWWVAKGGKLK